MYDSSAPSQPRRTEEAPLLPLRGFFIPTATTSLYTAHMTVIDESTHNARTKGRYDIRKAKLITPTAIHESVRVVWSNGRLAVWREDHSAWTADRIFLLDDVTFYKRRVATVPHLIQVGTETWQVIPLYAGGCGCTPYPLKGISYTQLIEDGFSHVGES